MSDNAQAPAASQPTTSTSNPASANNAGATPSAAPAAPETSEATNVTTQTSGNKETQAPAQETGGQVGAVYDEAPEQTEGEQKEETPDPANEVPESYEFAEGIGPALDEATTKQYQDAFKEAGLTRKQAEILFKHNQENMQAAFQSITDGWTKQVNEWVEQIDKDTALGGAQAAQRDINMRRALKAFGTPELKKYLRGGVGMNPEVVRFINAVGASLGEDNHFVGGRTPEQEKQINIDKLRYPNSPDMWGH